MDRGAPGSELYALDPEQFTAARNALVKQLRSEGRREDAVAVGRLRRPPATAWALNEMARERPALVEAVLEAGEKLRAAMERALAGDASALREAQVGERRAIDAATAAAAGRLESTGRAAGDSARQRMAASLRAAVMDPSVAEAVVAGVLDADHGAPGFGLEGLAVRAPDASGAAGGSHLEAGRAEAPAAPAPDEESESERRDTRRQRERLAAAADEAEQRARDTDRTAAAGERRARELRAAADVAAAEADRAARRARELESAAGAAERTAKRDRAAAEQAAEQAAAARGQSGAGD